MNYSLPFNQSPQATRPPRDRNRASHALTSALQLCDSTQDRSIGARSYQSIGMVGEFGLEPEEGERGGHVEGGVRDWW